MTKIQLQNQITKLKNEIIEFDTLGLLFSKKCAESELKRLNNKLFEMELSEMFFA